MFAHLPYRFSFADFKSVFKNRLRFGEKWRDTKQSTLFISGRGKNIVMELMRRTGANDVCVAFALLGNFIFVFSRVLRDSTPRYVGPSVGRLVPFLLFQRF